MASRGTGVRKYSDGWGFNVTSKMDGRLIRKIRGISTKEEAQRALNTVYSELGMVPPKMPTRKKAARRKATRKKATRKKTVRRKSPTRKKVTRKKTTRKKATRKKTTRRKSPVRKKATRKKVARKASKKKTTKKEKHITADDIIKGRVKIHPAARGARGFPMYGF